MVSSTFILCVRLYLIHQNCYLWALGLSSSQGVLGRLINGGAFIWGALSGIEKALSYSAAVLSKIHFAFTGFIQALKGLCYSWLIHFV